ncbi:hypothetical protein LPJ78_005537 [Coemansia sp. RSA 989]|nr:hypothetical protein BX667DRAFT_508713 [Coemansia mojavensis]KAJ1738644.1 hypothetical protein LPJ68_005383 [Coemansia sp. RSA 1086]KAJ1747073.1 hypothetical protein LPJ79_005504 [Coemansia sp. RSA 1821]KAJ1861086.1 hypothetical protein LPJ78_005537 [Coemansia sp. RSA 989]KAJ1869143.1 hypothetical protein LPJ55_005573 [Coemansia sp. RSA 990]KAJ2632276.1 hypothetical protein H4R22_001387 [Coemansia sp. RSA 1290]KAJ2647451.1 hypothetical protein IWW40_004652 [Coemansia sp. RSA 1250]KAJ26677
MSRHSKNNNSLGVFTYAERQMTDYGTKRKRLGQDSKRRFDACYLCLQTAISPMMCRKGHISCKECAISSILEQKQAIERDMKRYTEAIRQQKELKLKDEQKRREVKEMDRYRQRQVGLSSKVKEIINEDQTKKRVKLLSYEPDQPPVEEPGDTEEKRLSSFWVPSMAPSIDQTVKPPAHKTPQCLATSQPHALKLKSLIEVKFKQLKNEKLCPSCDRPLTSSSKIDVLAKCGHAICHKCINTFVLTSKECFVCQLKVEPKDILAVETEGTGFTAGGGPMVATKYESALQA